MGMPRGLLLRATNCPAISVCSVSLLQLLLICTGLRVLCRPTRLFQGLSPLPHFLPGC